jgi:hypothetical protein
MQVIKESLWQELADITDKTQLGGGRFSGSESPRRIPAAKWSV